jgi:hypothetical protein
MDRNIEDIYLQMVVGDSNYKSPKRLEHLYEDVSLYVRDGEDYKPIGNVSDEIYRKVQRFASGKNTTGIISSYLNDKFYTQDSFKGEDDFTTLIDLLDDGEFENYIESEGKPKLADNRVNNIINLASKNGMSEELAMKIARFTPVDKGGSNLGPGEVLLALTFSDVTNAVGGGDLSIGGEALEVKGQGGRLGQQAGRGGIKFDTDALTSNLNNPPDIKAVSLEVIIHQLYKAYQAEGKESSFVNDLKRGLKSAYPYSKMEFLNKVDYNSLSTKQGITVTRGDIRKALTKINLDNYALKYDYNDFVFIDKSKLNYAMFKREEALRDGGLIDTEKIVTSNYSINDFYPNFKFNF